MIYIKKIDAIYMNKLVATFIDIFFTEYLLIQQELVQENE